MKIYLLILLTSLLFASKAQDTIKISKTFIGSKRIEKIITVFKSDTNIFHGNYTSYHANGRVFQTGTYYIGKRDGNWKSYYDNGNTETETFYLEGKESGIWNYFTYDGLPSCSFNMDSILKTEISDKNKLVMRLRYPDKAMEMEIQGDVDAGILVDNSCLITKFVILKDIGGGCGAAVLELLNKNKDVLQKQFATTPCVSQQYKLTFHFIIAE